LFRDRNEAGQRLAKELSEYADRPDVIVLGLPRGGVPVAFEVAKALNVALDIFLVRKLGLPGQEEMAIGAIASGGVQVLNHQLARTLSISDQTIQRVAEDEWRELERREQAYRGDRSSPDVQNRTVILVDDGLATGASMWAAVTALRKKEPARIVVAVPTAAPQTCEAFEDEVNEVICATTPQPFMGVGAWYEDFSQTTDVEVREYLERAADLLPA